MVEKIGFVTVGRLSDTGGPGTVCCRADPVIPCRVGPLSGVSEALLSEPNFLSTYFTILCFKPVLGYADVC